VANARWPSTVTEVRTREERLRRFEGPIRSYSGTLQRINPSSVEKSCTTIFGMTNGPTPSRVSAPRGCPPERQEWGCVSRGASKPTSVVSGMTDDFSSIIEEGEGPIDPFPSDSCRCEGWAGWAVRPPEKSTRLMNRYNKASEQAHNPRARKTRVLRQVDARSQAAMGSRSGALKRVW
jgi:hypothetical protein